MKTILLNPREEQRILQGHDWVFSNEIRKPAEPIQPGELVEVQNASGRFLGIGFYNPHSLIAARLLSRHPATIDENFFLEKLRRALQYRQTVKPGAKSFRLCHGESDGLPGLILDKYEEYLSVQILAFGMEKLWPLIREALEKLLRPKGVLLKNNHPLRELEKLPLETRVDSGDIPERIQIEENGVRFLVNLMGGQKTGFFFDQSENRERAASCSKDKNILDLFCYTGGFGLCAARAGAVRVVGMDSSRPAIELARENAQLNGFQDRCRYSEQDAASFLESEVAKKSSLPFDLIILDPPTFAPSKKDLPKALWAYLKLNSLALKCLEPGGILATSTCSHHVTRDHFLCMLFKASAKAQKRVRLIEYRTQAKDHPILLAMPETQYLHFALLQVL